MKLIIAGGRNVPDIDSESIQAFINYHGITGITEIVSGTAKGVDRAGEDYANENGIPLKQFPANWAYYGRAAGHIRNKEMAEYADALLVIWDGKSSGSGNMKDNMIKLGKPYWEIIY